MNSTTPESIESPANVLLISSGDCDVDACERLRETADGTAELRISFASDPAHATAPRGEQPAHLGFVSVGDILRSASAESAVDPAAPVITDAVEDPTDLPAIGRSVSRICEGWSRRDERITVCFRSLDALLRHAPASTVFGFAHVLTERFASVDAHAHVHFDATAHDDATVATFATLFDTVVNGANDPDSLPEATDEEVATTLESWRDDGGFDLPEEPTQATDDDIARLLEP